VVAPKGEQRVAADVLIELADRAGFGDDYNAALNAQLGLEGDNRLRRGRKYSYQEVCDADLKNVFGPEHNLDWFKRNGVIKWPKQPQEVYWRMFTDVRVPIYWEWMGMLFDKTSAVMKAGGMSLPKEFYQPLPEWLPCPSHECTEAGFDFYAFYYRDIIHTNSFTMENAWLDEAARLDPFSYTIAVNTDAATTRGLTSGDLVAVETESGRRVEGRLCLTEAIHPEGLGIAAMCGHWTDGMPLAKGKGVFFNDLLDLDRHHVSPVNLNLDLCARVRITRLEPTPGN